MGFQRGLLLGPPVSKVEVREPAAQGRLPPCRHGLPKYLLASQMQLGVQQGWGKKCACAQDTLGQRPPKRWSYPGPWLWVGQCEVHRLSCSHVRNHKQAPGCRLHL